MQAHKAFSAAIDKAGPEDELHVFYSNRSLCSLSLDKPEDAQADARKVHRGFIPPPGLQASLPTSSLVPFPPHPSLASAGGGAPFLSPLIHFLSPFIPPLSHPR